MQEYYTYAYLREDKTPYYIGKGKGNRAFRKHKVQTPPKDKILFLKKNLTEEQAFLHEIYMISVFGRKDLKTGILENKNSGGNGSSGKVYSKEEKDKIRKNVIGRKWWNNGIENTHSKICPGNEWVIGRLVTWDETKRLENMKESASKVIYKLTHITGEVAFCKNLHDIGKKCGHKNGFYRVHLRQRKSYKGWISVEICNNDNVELDERKIINLCNSVNNQRYKVTHKNGKVIYTNNLNKLGIEYGYSDGFCRILRGERKSYKGWISVQKI